MAASASAWLCKRQHGWVSVSMAGYLISLLVMLKISIGYQGSGYLVSFLDTLKISIGY